jgi:hypothetical protein
MLPVPFTLTELMALYLIGLCHLRSEVRMFVLASLRNTIKRLGGIVTLSCFATKFVPLAVPFELAGNHRTN